MERALNESMKMCAKESHPVSLHALVFVQGF